jgi:hypothetical protein
MCGRSEAQRLARCRAQMQHRLRDGQRIGSGSDRRHLPRADEDMVFAASLLSLGGSIRPCIASSKSRG